MHAKRTTGGDTLVWSSKQRARACPITENGSGLSAGWPWNFSAISRVVTLTGTEAGFRITIQDAAAVCALEASDSTSSTFL